MSSDNAPPSPPTALLSANPLAWLMVFGPGAIIASLTIGTGELIFSTRGGVLFGYRILFLFLVICVLKWGLVFAAARHMVLSGVHPYQRMMELPGPRGWMAWLLLLLAAVCLPIWIGFHSGVVGNLFSWMTSTQALWQGGSDYVWGAAVLAAVVTISWLGGYQALERTQLLIITALVGCAGVTLVIYGPDWGAMIWGALVPQRLSYPEWLSTDARLAPIAAEPVWVETTRYVGVIGGAGFDYMAYATWLRDKDWGWAGRGPVAETQLAAIAADPRHPARLWVRAPLVDCSASFLLLIVFTAVFVASGVVILGPHHEIPTEENLLSLQARFVTDLHPWLMPLYGAGALLAMLGTLYGTLEVGSAIAVELTRSLCPHWSLPQLARTKHIATAWCATGAMILLSIMLVRRITGGVAKPRLLLDVLTPANLFTGVFACGVFTAAVCWMDRRFLPRSLRMPWPLTLLNLLASVVFLFLGVKGFWDRHDPAGPFLAQRTFPVATMAVVLTLSLLLATTLPAGRRR